ncbi:MAG: hypothetical protein IPJ07_17535 [Acidobacteria bacterium]|nr:hypothetical protein [Acidobacteriota bacterium]
MKKLLIVLALTTAVIAIYLPDTVSSNAPGSNQVTFTKDVAPIFRNKCEECHRSGGVAPMSFATYEEARPWSKSIREKVVSREMPPFHAAGPLGQYQHDPRLTDDEVATIAKWIEGGSQKGNLKDMPAPKTWKNEWPFRQPDLAVKVKSPYKLKAGKTDQYVFFVFDYVFPEETWVKSIVTRPGNLKVVHHANTHVVPPMVKVPDSGYIEGDFEPSARGTVMVAGWAPGVSPVLLTEGVAVKIPKGMKLGIQIHYAPSETDQIDETQVGVYFAEGMVNKNLRVLFGDRKDLSIPPNDPAYSLTSTKTFDTDAIIDFYHIHMHLRGKSYLIRLTYPDGRQETAIEVPRYDFNWQRTYLLTQPLRVPKGTKVDFIGTYDNSSKNKFNPDPSQSIKWGEKTTDEMMQGRIFYESVDEKLNLKVKKGVVVRETDTAVKTN